MKGCSILSTRLSEVFYFAGFSLKFITSLLQTQADQNNDGIITINELKEYVSKKVIQLTNGSQQPTARRELLENDWIIW